jgi:L-fuculose-phosphate aldolase
MITNGLTGTPASGIMVGERGGRMAGDTDAVAGISSAAAGADHGDVSVADREGLVSYARRMAADDLAPGTSGNLSVRRGGLMAITPSGVPYERMTPADICLVRTSDAALISGPRPSTETPMHLALYQASHAGAIVHTHSPFVIALSTVLDELPAVHYAMADLGGPVRVAPYARFGTTQLAASAAAKLTGRNAVILRNHGALACGPTLERAYERACTLEWLARVYWYARLAGAPQTLSESALAEVGDAVRALRYGEAAPPSGAAPPSAAAPPTGGSATDRGAPPPGS